MNVASLQFVGVCAAAAVIFQSIPGVGIRRLFFAVLNAAFIVTLVPNRRSWLCLALFLIGTYGLVKLAGRVPSRWLVGCGIATVLAAFLVLKRYSFARPLLPITSLWEQVGPVEVIGLSYMLFKFIHALVDQSQGQLAPVSFFSYLNYQLAFFTLPAGPIQRYNDFRQSWEAMDIGTPAGECETLAAWGRVWKGLFKMAGVAPLAWYAFERAKSGLGPTPAAFSPGAFALYFYSYPVFLYFNFSGYTDIALGVGRLFGFAVPENFNRPYLARSVIDFWNRWHMSLTLWIRDYVFMTSYKVAAERFPNSARYSGYFLLFLALFLAGVWHGSAYGYAVFGAVNGLGAAANQVYGDVLRWRLGKAGFQRYLKNRWVELAAVVLTFHYFCFSMLFFSSGVQSPLRLLRSFWLYVLSASADQALPGPGSGVFVFACVASAAAVLLYHKTAVGAARAWLTARASRSGASRYRTVLAGAAAVVLVCVVQWVLGEKDPVVVYLGF